MARSMMIPDEAPNEGARLLRTILQRNSTGQVARRLGCLRQTVWNWARGATPDPGHRGKLYDVFAIPLCSWTRDPARHQAT